MCAGSFKNPERPLGDWAYCLTYLSKKTRRSNHLQLLKQRQHLLLYYFKTPSVGPAESRTQVSHTTDWHFTNLDNHVVNAINLTRKLSKQYLKNLSSKKNVMEKAMPFWLPPLLFQLIVNNYPQKWR